MISPDTITQNLIPQEKTEAVTRALREAFGVTAFEDIRMMTNGLSSALVFRIVVRGAPFLLRIITRTDALNDPTRQFACMRAAVEPRIAPHVWYASIEDRLSITDFVEAEPFSIDDALLRMPAVLRTLHALPPFPTAMNYGVLDGFIRRFEAAELIPKAATEEPLARYAQMAAVYPHLDPDMVSSHNDLKPENIIYDGHRPWLVDWEAAFLNDRYFDLSIIANFVVNSDADEQIYLREYFGQPPDEYQLARFFLMRQAMHMFYATVFLSIGSSGKPLDQTENAPGFQDFHQRIWSGEVSLAGNDMKIAYGRTHWQQMSQNMRTARFDEALRTVSNRHAATPGRLLLRQSQNAKPPAPPQ